MFKKIKIEKKISKQTIIIKKNIKNIDGNKKKIFFYTKKNLLLNIY